MAATEDGCSAEGTRPTLSGTETAAGGGVTCWELRGVGVSATCGQDGMSKITTMENRGEKLVLGRAPMDAWTTNPQDLGDLRNPCLSAQVQTWRRDTRTSWPRLSLCRPGAVRRGQGKAEEDTEKKVVEVDQTLKFGEDINQWTESCCGALAGFCGLTRRREGVIEIE